MSLTKYFRDREKADLKAIEKAITFLREATIPEPQDERNVMADALEGIYNRLQSLENRCALIEPDDD